MTGSGSCTTGGGGGGGATATADEASGGSTFAAEAEAFSRGADAERRISYRFGLWRDFTCLPLRSVSVSAGQYLWSFGGQAHTEGNPSFMNYKL